MSSPLSPDDRRLLGHALDLALRGEGRTCPNPMVGAIVVREGRIVGSGFHARAGEAHAEAAALDDAAGAAAGADMYVSLEPCCHHGRTPPCTDRIVAAGIRRVVAAVGDPNPLVNGRGFARLSEAGVLVAPLDPLFAKRAGRMNEVFFKFITTGIPFVALKAGMTLDGRIALGSGASRWITGAPAREHARGMRGCYGAVLIGAGTAIVDDPLLLPAAVRVVLDSQLRLPVAARLAASAREGRVIVYASHGAEDAKARALEAAGVEIARLGPGRPALPLVLSDLASRGVSSILVEGGGEVLGAFLREGLADKVHLYVAPKLLGGRDSVPAFGGPGPAGLEEALELEDSVVRRIGGDVLIEAYPRLAGRRAEHR